MRDHKRENTRAIFHALAGFYLLYLARELFHGLGEMTEHKWLFVPAILVFGIVGAALIVSGVWRAYKLQKKSGELDGADETVQADKVAEAEEAAKLEEASGAENAVKADEAIK